MNIPELARRSLYKVALGYWWLRRPLTLGVRALVTDEDRKILLVRHTYIDGWYFPGGGVDKSESIDQAATRELKEEVGVEPVEPIRLIGIFSNFTQYKSDHIALFHVNSFEMSPSASGEIAEFGFFSASELPEGTTAGTRRRIDEFFTGTASPFVW